MYFLKFNVSLFLISFPFLSLSLLFGFSVSLNQSPSTNSKAQRIVSVSPVSQTCIYCHFFLNGRSCSVGDTITFDLCGEKDNVSNGSPYWYVILRVDDL